MNISDDEFYELIDQVAYPVISRCLSLYKENPDNFSSNDFKVMLSGRYYEHWKGNTSDDILEEVIKPIAYKSWKIVSNIVGLYDRENEISQFSEDQVYRMIITIAGSIWRNLLSVKEKENRGLYEVYNNGKSQGFRQGLFIGVMSCIGLVIIGMSILSN